MIIGRRRLVTATAAALVTALALATLPPASAVDKDSSGPDAAWDSALVVLPGGQKLSMAEAVRTRAFDRATRNTITVLYLHGCDGLHPHDPVALGRAGFLVVAPDSMKRWGREADCKGPGKYGNFPLAAIYRMEEIRYAVKQLSSMPQIDPTRLVLFGHSEGGRAVANWEGPEFRAAVMTGWNCRTRDATYRGVKLPTSVAILNIVSKDDEWLALNKGDSCEPWLANHPVKQIINPPGKKHWMNDVYYQDIVRFLQSNGG